MKLNKVINLQNKEAMTKTITFNELRRLKDSLPDGSTHRIADELGISVETVRNYFGGHNFKDGKSCGIHIEPGPDGGLVVLDDTTIFERALQILAENEEVSEASVKKFILQRNPIAESEKTLWDFFSQHLVISDCLIYKNTRVWKIN